MTQRFLGIEIGTQTVRLLRLTGSGRGFVADLYHEEPIDHADGTRDGLVEALGQLSRQGLLSAEVCAVNVPSGAAMVIELQLPFSERKAIEAVLPAQLAGRMPVTDEHLVDFTVVGPNPTNPDVFDVLVLAYPIGLASARLETVSSAGHVDPQFALPLTLLEHRAARYLVPEAQGCWALLDIGARTCRLTLMDGTRFVSSREILVGGDAITELIAEDLDLGHDAAEALKRERGFVAPVGQEQAWLQQLIERGAVEHDPSWDPRPVAQAARFGLTPIVVGLRQTLSAHTLETGRPVERVVLAGGGAWLHGIGPYLAEQVGIAVQPLRLEQPELTGVAANPLAHPEMVGSLSLALYAAELFSGGLELNLRRGQLAYKGSLEFLKEHAIPLAVLGFLLVGAVMFALWMQLRALDIEREQLKTALAEATDATFGQELYDQTAIETEIDAADRFNFLPRTTAFDILAGLSDAATRQLPDVDFEFSKLDINMTQRMIVFTADTNEDESIRRVTSVVASHPCVSDDVPEPKTKRVRGRVEFTVRVGAAECLDGAK